MRRRPLQVLLLLLSSLSLDARSDSLSSLPDPLYAYRDPGQPEPIAARVRAIVYPTLGLPALVGHRGELDVLVRSESSNITLPDWKVRIATRLPGAAFALEVLSAERDESLALTKLHVRIPARAPRETYHLTVEGRSLRDTQPNAVRITGVVSPEYRFAVLADHQLWDPSWKIHDPDRSARDWPRRGETDENRAMARQQLAELALLDPDFVIHAGDLLFGLDYAREYDEAWRFMQESPVATFMVPGNHDGYATYGVQLAGTPLRLAAGLAACHHLVKPPFDWPRAFALLQCVYGDIKGFLFSQLRRDGLSYWRRTFGPLYYAWDHGDLHFVALNTYDGTPARRHSYALYVDALDLHLGAPAVDNFGGELGEEQLRWLADDLARARRMGKTVVVIGHHDPRGNLTVPEADRYQANRPFPTSPLGLGPFQEWNYEGPAWSSAGNDRPGSESPTRHSGTRLLELLVEHAAYYVDGHAHRDEHRRYAAGEEVAPGIRARHPIEFLRVTTASSAPASPTAYWGYRLITVRGRQLAIEAYDRANQLESLPGGNLWTEATSATAQWVRCGLPRPTTGLLRFRLPERPKGWRFLDVQTQEELPLYDLAPAASKGKPATFMVGVRIEPPAEAPFPVAPGTRRFEARPAHGNRAPLPALQIRRSADDREPTSGVLRVVAGEPVELNAQATRDPDGDAVRMIFITTPDGREARAHAVPWTFPTIGRFSVTVEAMDGHGAKARKTFAIVAHRRADH
jgi:3',5'-cyclic AMP phosphodiesterase CpdA